MKKNKKIYYDVRKDLEAFPDAWCIITWSKRGAGKTYSMLRLGIEEEETLLYMKRTNEDIDFLCSGSKIEKITKKDPSPYFPLNRDFGYNIKPVLISKGYAGFFQKNSEGEVIGEPVSFALSLNNIKQFKGFDFSYVLYMVLDEFIPQTGEIVKKKEGEMLLDMYMTVSRDREARGNKCLKLILFANAEQISTPITNTLEIVDDMAELEASGERYKYIEERGILLHHITQEECPQIEEEKQGIYKGMQGTAWFDKVFEGRFSNNDFTNVKKKKNLKGFSCVYALKHQRKWIFFYKNKNNNDWYVCSTPGNASFKYDLSRENEQVRFYEEVRPFLYDACISDLMKFEKYSFYDLLINFKKFYNI